MKRTKLFFLGVFVALSNFAIAQYKLEIKLNNLSSKNGQIKLSLYDANQNSVMSRTVTLENNECTIFLENVEAGKYALSYYHDENLNDKLDKNLLGIPKEGYGFSNNAYGMYGPEPFENWLFEIKDNTRIELITKY
ncbi:DUF2141 domain-containing protein [Bacteroidota bacterium]